MNELLEFCYMDVSDNNTLSWVYHRIYLLHLLVYHFD